MDVTEQIRQNFERVQENIDRALLASGRSLGSARLLVVTKGQSIESIEAAYRAGVRLFGENYPEETLPKIQSLAGCGGVEWHMIGHLQSRKAKIVAENFTMLHSLDSFGLAEKMDRLLKERSRTLPVLLEVNVSGEESKGGWHAWDEQTRETLYAEIENILRFDNLLVRGLMVMPPLFDVPELTRPYFQKARKLREILAGRYPQAGWEELSMGTSADFEIAIQEGSTFVRIGTAIMGPRPPRA